MTTQIVEPYTVPIFDGPGSALIMLSLHCLLMNEKPPLCKFFIGKMGNHIIGEFVVTGVSVVEAIEGSLVDLKVAYQQDASRFCPLHSQERERKEFKITGYNHHSPRKGNILIPSAYAQGFRIFQKKMGYRE